MAPLIVHEACRCVVWCISINQCGRTTGSLADQINDWYSFSHRVGKLEAHTAGTHQTSLGIDNLYMQTWLTLDTFCYIMP